MFNKGQNHILKGDICEMVCICYDRWTGDQKTFLHRDFKTLNLFGSLRLIRRLTIFSTVPVKQVRSCLWYNEWTSTRTVKELHCRSKFKVKQVEISTASGKVFSCMLIDKFYAKKIWCSAKYVYYDLIVYR